MSYFNMIHLCRFDDAQIIGKNNIRSVNSDILTNL